MKPIWMECGRETYYHTEDKYLNKDVNYITQRQAFKDCKEKPWYFGKQLKFYISLKQNGDKLWEAVRRPDLYTQKEYNETFTKFYWKTFKNFSWKNVLYLYRGKKYLAIEHSDGKHYILYQHKIVVPKEAFEVVGVIK